MLIRLKCRILRMFYSIALFPHMLATTLVVYALTALYICGLIAAYIAWPLLCIVISFFTYHNRHNKPTPLSSHFAVYAAPGATWSVIAQYHTEEEMDCWDTMCTLVKEQRTLIDAIPVGKYRAVTHDTVVRRIEAADSLQLRRIELLGLDNLSGIRRHMRGCNCHRCKLKKNCRFFQMIQKNRQFYYVEFEKR